MSSNSDYEAQYRKWVDSLTPKQRAKLVAQGLDQPLIDDGRTNATDPSVAFETVGEEFDYGQFDKRPETANNDEIEQSAKAYGSLLLAWVFQRLQSRKSEKNASLDRDTLLFALGLENLLVLKTQTDIAKLYGVTRACVSAKVKGWQKLLGLKPSSLMKSEKACKSYRQARLENLTRKR